MNNLNNDNKDLFLAAVWNRTTETGWIHCGFDSENRDVNGKVERHVFLQKRILLPDGTVRDVHPVSYSVNFGRWTYDVTGQVERIIEQVRKTLLAAVEAGYETCELTFERTVHHCDAFDPSQAPSERDKLLTIDMLLSTKSNLAVPLGLFDCSVAPALKQLLATKGIAMETKYSRSPDVPPAYAFSWNKEHFLLP